MSRTFEVAVERDGPWWFAKVAELPGVHTQTKRLEQVETEIRPLVAYFAEIPEADIVLEQKIDLSPSVNADLDQLELLRELATLSQEQLSELTRELAYLLVDDGLPQRDIGRILGLSFQRVSQLLKERARQTA